MISEDLEMKLAAPTNSPEAPPGAADGPGLRERALDLLEFPKVREALASYAATPMSRERALALTPAYDAAAVAELQRETAEAALLLDDAPDLALERDPRPILRRAAMDGALSGPELIAVADALDAARRAKTLGGAQGARAPLLRNVARNIADLRPLEREIRAKLTPAGALRDDASPLLLRLCAESRDAYQRAANALQASIDSGEAADALQDNLFTVRGERLALPVKADFKGKVPGVVHGASDSGATLFIEPFFNVERGNRWREAAEAEQEEARRILRSLSASVGRRAGDGLHAMDALARLDAAFAKARYAHSYDGAAVQESDGEARLIAARHPLLGADAVPVSLRVGPPATMLVITGPNTGGKTVALKTLGLLALMRQSGLRLPCDGESELPVFDGVYADVGDQQSIERSVSTFSSHLSAIAEILARATPRSLVLLDELGAATDPDEGAALGCAIAAHLAERGVPCAATTHHRALAALAEEHPAMANASVELDARTLRPTYKLSMGLPGRSYAMEIAERVGLDARVVASARERLGPAHRETEGLLAAIRQERAAVREKLDEAEAERREAAERAADLAARIEALDAAQAAVIEQTRAELREDAKRARAKLRQAESAAEWRASEGGPPPARVIREASESVEDVRRELRSRSWGKRPPAPGERKAGIAAGDVVEIAPLGFRGTALAAPDESGRVETLVGGARALLDASRLRRVGSADAALAPSVSALTPSLSRPAGEGVGQGRGQDALGGVSVGGSVGISAEGSVGLELDVRGKRADDAVEALETYLDAALAHGLARVRVIHGKGTGALRNAVWRRLAAGREAASYALAPRERGGEGATEVELA